MARAIKDVFEEKARGGDGSFAIAYALLEISEANDYMAKMLARLGFEGPGSVPAPGALEYVGMQLRDIASALDHLTVSASVDVTNNG